MGAAGHGVLASSTLSSSRLLAWICIAIGVVYLVFVGGTWAGIYTPELRVISVVVGACALALWWIAAYRSTAWRPRTVLYPVIGASLGSLAISTVLSRNPRVSVEYLAYAVILWALYLLLVRLFANPFFRNRLITLAGLLFVSIAWLYIAVILARWISFWGVLGRLAVPPLRPEFEALSFGNPSAVLTIVVLLAVPALAALPAGRIRAPAVGMTFLTIALVALASGSRAGWAALATVAIVGAVFAVVDSGLRARVRGMVNEVRVRPRLAGIAMAGVILLAALAVPLTPAILARVMSGGEDVRQGFAAAAIRMFTEAPQPGWGPACGSRFICGRRRRRRPSITSPMRTTFPYSQSPSLAYSDCLPG
jgi:hypothetical protein